MRLGACAFSAHGHTGPHAVDKDEANLWYSHWRYQDLLKDAILHPQHTRLNEQQQTRCSFS